MSDSASDIILEPIIDPGMALPLPADSDLYEANNLLDKYRKRMYLPTSRKDLEYMLNGKTNIVSYDEINGYKSFDDLITPYQSVIILYPSAADPNIGHWCCCFIIPGSNPSRVEYFDPYGCYIDQSVSDYNEETLHQRRPLEPLLLELLIASPYANNVYWNETPFQSETRATQCCGLWSVLRLKCNHMTETEFEKLYFDAPTEQGILPDLLVSAIICDMYPEMRN